MKEDSNVLASGDLGIDLRKYLVKFLLYWKWIVLSMIICLAIAFLINRYTVPTFQVRGTMLIGSNQDELSSIFESKSGGMVKGSNFQIANQLAILNSYEMAREVIDSLDLYVSCFLIGNINETERFGEELPFEVDLLSDKSRLTSYSFLIKIIDGNSVLISTNNGEKNQTLTFNEEFELSNNRLKLIKSQTYDKSYIGNNYRVDILSQESAIRKCKSEIQATSASDGSSVVLFNAYSSNTFKAKTVINRYITTYIQRDIRLKGQSSENALRFIQEQLREVRKELFSTEEEIQDFKKENLDFLNGGAASGAMSMNEQEMLIVNERFDLGLYEYMQRYLSKSDSATYMLTPLSLGVEDLELTKLVEQFNQLQSRRTGLMRFATVKNPVLQAVQAELLKVKKLIVDNLDNKINTLKRLIEHEEDRFYQVNKELKEQPLAQRKWVDMERRYAINNGLYTFLLQKNAELSITKASTVSSSERLDPPYVVAKISPENSRNLMIGLLGSLLIPFVILFLKEQFTTTIQGTDEVEGMTEVPILASIGLSRHESELVMYEKPRSVVAEGFRAMRTALSFIVKEQLKCLMFTSYTSGDGKTFAAINTAIMMAKTGKKTILLGLDLRKPKIFDSFGFDNSEGISQILIGDKNWVDLVKHTQVENLDFIGAGPVPPNPNELLIRERFMEFVSELKNIYDYVIIDTAPIGLVSDSFEIAKHADAVIYVLRHKVTPKQSLFFLNDSTKKELIHNVGILYNGVDFNKNKYGYAYGQGYGYGYGYGHGYYTED